MFNETASDIEVETVVANLWRKVEGSIGVLLAVSSPSGDFVFAPNPDDVKRSNENLDEAIAGLQALGISVTRDGCWQLAATRDALRKKL